MLASNGWAMGITLSVLASIIGAASKLAIRKSFLMDERGLVEMIKNRQRGRHEQMTTTSTTTATAAWLRLSGMVGMAVLNPACGVLAMNYASPSLVAPFSGLDLVWVIMLSHALVGEDPTSPQIVAASLVVAGEALTAVFGDHTNSNDTSSTSYPETLVVLQDLLQSYRDPAFLAYLVGFTLWMVLVIHWMNLPPNRSPMLQRFAWGVSGGSVTGLQHFVKDWLTLVQAMMHDNHTNKTSLSSSSNLDLDCDHRLWCNPWLVLWILALLSMMTAIGGLLLLTACMQRYNATFSSAMFVGSFVLNSSIMSAVHYHTFSHLTSILSWVLYPVGLLILLAGVLGVLVSTPSMTDNGASHGTVDESNVLLESHALTMKKTVDLDIAEDGRGCCPWLSLLMQETRGGHVVVTCTCETGDAQVPEEGVSKYGSCGTT